jgi:outer membrane protein OmpA-like peptidoglycan-associated protein
MKKRRLSSVNIGLAGMILLMMVSGCRSTHTSYFGVEEKSLTAPKEFKQTQAVIENAKETADSLYARKKIDEAMNLGREAAIVYWACYDREALNLLEHSRLAAYDAQLYHPQPPPPLSNRSTYTQTTPNVPKSLDPGPPFAALKNLPPRMILEKVHFDFDSSVLKTPEKQILGSRADFLVQHANIGYEIAGHTDIVGTDDHNKALSEKRAEIVLYYLASQGVPPHQMVPVAYGKHDILDPDPTEEGQKKNRRAEVRVTASASLVPAFVLQNIADLPAGTPIEIICFNYDDDRLLPIQQALLDQTIRLLRQHPTVALEIDGHAYAEGTENQMAGLSQRRINIVREYLVSNGVSGDRIIQTRVFTDRSPLSEAVSAEPLDNRNRRWNRRVEIRIAHRS